MARRNVIIKAVEAVNLIRAGADDATLMERFNISPGGLQRLLQQLVASGVLRASELEARLTRAHEVDHIAELVTDMPPLPPGKPVIDAAEALKAIRCGYDAAQLMKQFNLSAKGLQSLFKKLVDAEVISQEEIDDRMASTSTWVELDADMPPPPDVTVRGQAISQEELLNHVRSGWESTKIKSKFDVTTTELMGMLNKLVSDGLISEPELEERNPLPSDTLEIRRSSGEIAYAGRAPSLSVLVQNAVQSGTDLSGCDFQSADFARADLSGGRFIKCNFTRANLAGADLTGAHLNGAVLCSSDMYGAILYKANLADADLSDANMAKVHGVWAFMPNANLSECNLTEANLAGANLSGANVFEAILRGANLLGAFLDNVNLKAARTGDAPG